MATVSSIDFEALGRDLSSWYEHGDQVAARRALLRIQRPVRGLVARKHQSWGDQQVRDTTQDVLAHLFDRDRRPLAQADQNPKAHFWRCVRNRIVDVGRGLVRGREAGRALEAEPRLGFLSSGGEPRSDAQVEARDELDWTARALFQITPNRSMSVIAYSAATWPPLHPRFHPPRAHAAERQGREDTEVEESFGAIDSDDKATVACAALGQGAKVNAYEQNLSRARKDLRSLREEAA